MIQVQQVSAGYGGGLVLRDVTVDIDGGQATCIVGPNGAGKSTMLKVICDDLRPSSGRVRIDDTEITGHGPGGAIRQGVVMIPQSGALFTGMTVRENVLMGGHATRMRRLAAKRRFDELSAVYPVIAERASAHAGLLSGGQRRMVEFARALMVRPKVILLDEPSIGLDPKSRETLAASVGALVDEGATVVMVEQNVRFGLSLASTGIVMEGGRIVASAPAATLLEDPDLRAVFVGGHTRSEDEA